MTRKDVVREIKDEANRRAMNDPHTRFVVEARNAIELINGLDLDEDAV